jgi:hypothetical protein
MLSLVLLAKEENVNQEENVWKKMGITILKIIGALFFIIFIIVLCLFFNALLSGYNSGKLKIEVGRELNLKLKTILNTEKDELTLKFIIKEIFGNKITLQYKICRGGKTILTKIIGVDKTKKLSTQFKKSLTFPINISVNCSNNLDNEMKINIKGILKNNTSISTMNEW